MDTASIPGAPRAWTRGLLGCGVAAGPVFVAVFVLEGAVRDGYRPLRHPVSSLALGSRGWIPALISSRRAWRAGQRAFALCSAGTAVIMPAAMALAAAGFGQSPRLVRLGGLFQRASISTGLAWLTALSVRARQHAPATGSAKPSASATPPFPVTSTPT